MTGKMMDGDVIDFGTENGKQDPFSVDCKNVSVVMLGAFETLLEKKSKNAAKHIGFGAAPEAEAGPPCHAGISYDDLIDAGTRREIAGRINTIVALNPLDVPGYKAILEGPVISGLQDSLGSWITIDDDAIGMLSEQAETSGLGVRWIKSSVSNAVNDAMFDAPEAREYHIGLQNGELCCRAYIPHENTHIDYDFEEIDLDAPPA